MAYFTVFNAGTLLRYFRINDPYRVIVLLGIALVCALPYFINRPPEGMPELKSILIGEKISHGDLPYIDFIDTTPPLTSWIYGFLDLVFGDSILARRIFGFLLLFAIGMFTGLIFINKKVFAETTYLPVLFFVILIPYSYDNAALTGELVGLLFLLFGLRSLMRELESHGQHNDTVLNLGIFVSLASLCVFSYSVFLIPLGLAMVIHSRRDFKSIFLLILAFLLPHLLLFSFYFMLGAQEALWNFYYEPGLSFFNRHLVDLKSLLIVLGIPLLYVGVSLLLVNKDSRFTKYQSQLVQVMVLWVLASVVLFFASNDVRPQTFLTLLPAGSFFLTQVYLTATRKRITNLTFWILFLGVPTIGIMARHGLVPVSYEGLQVSGTKYASGKRLMVLTDDLAAYQHNVMASPFVDWKLSETILKEPDYYENVARVWKAFDENPPELIIDPSNLLGNYFDRIPMLKTRYKQQSPGEYMLISN